jgi:hypothetical protein
MGVNMETIIDSIIKLKGVHHACIYQNGEQLASTFPENGVSIATAEEVIEQIFTALLEIERSYDEIYFSVGENYLAAFLMHDNHIALLLTDKKINFPLINLGVKSASAKIRLKIEAEKAEQFASMSAANRVSAFMPKTNPDFESVLKQLSSKLVYFLGPAAPFALQDCLNLWKQKYVQTLENLPHLIELILEEIDSDNEKNEFADFANTIIEQSLKV